MVGSRVYVGGLPYGTTERDLERFFRGYGRMRDVLIKNGYGFVEFDDHRDADDAVYELNGKKLLGERVTVERARGTPRGRDQWSSSRSDHRSHERYGPPTRTNYRLIVENLSSRISWQDLKDYMRQAGEVTYADAHKQHRNEGVVEFASYSDMKNAIDKLDDTELNGRRIRLVEDKSTKRRRSASYSSRSRSRSRSAKRSRSRSRSRRSSRSKSKSRSRSRSGSAKNDRKSRSRSASHKKSVDRSRSNSRKKSVERSRSRSHSRSPDNKRSKSREESKERSRSRSASKGRSKSRIMSFLDALKAKRDRLKPTETYVTSVDGKVYKQTKDSFEFVKNQAGYVVDTKPDKVPAKIVDYLYLGSQDCCEKEVLEEYSIKFVLSIGVEASTRYEGITYQFVDCLDLPETDLEKPLRECVPFIKNAINKHCNVLVHCNAGVSRSSSIVIGYLILDKGYTFSEAYEVVRSARSCIKPNVGFERQLRCLDKCFKN
nr:unnamed protein product [Callosobruchus analis]